MKTLTMIIADRKDYVDVRREIREKLKRATEYDERAYGEKEARMLRVMATRVYNSYKQRHPDHFLRIEKLRKMVEYRIV